MRVGAETGHSAIRRPNHLVSSVASVQPMRVPLGYDMAGSRLRSIGPLLVEYDMLGSRPSMLGDQELGYDMLGSRLRSIGQTRIDYDMAGSRPIRLGSSDLSYDMLGNRLRSIGPHELEYDMLGSRVRRVGRVTIDYDLLESRPSALETPDEAAPTDEEIIEVYLVLDRLRRAASASSTGA